MKKLPIGKQTFEVLIEDDYLYVDKTAVIHRLITEGDVYFLSRPRRFGKSLLVTTLKALFEGRRDLFSGLAIDSLDYEWKTYPVLHLDFSQHRVETAKELKEWLGRQAETFCKNHGLLVEGDYLDVLAEALESLHDERVVILIDEYDKPILDHIEDPEMAGEMREVLKGFYSTIKACDAHLRFVFLTGVSKFAKMSVFSGLNNLRDITLSDDYATMLGYTQEEIESYFVDSIELFVETKGITRQECLSEIREWYNGYSFSETADSVYNPFSTLLLFQNRKFHSYWFETGTPTFLLKLIREQEKPLVSELDGIRVGEDVFSSYEPERLQVLPLLFQTGYLTILGYAPEDDLYTLGYPNREVRRAFTTALLEEFAATPNGLNAQYTVTLRDALLSGDMESFFETMEVFFASVPYDIQIKQEKYYQTIFYLVFTLLGMKMQAEVRTNRGRIDAVAQTDETVYLFEFKLDGTAEEALAQIKEGDYARRYQADEKRIRCFGVAFDAETRNIGQWIEDTGS